MLMSNFNALYTNGREASDEWLAAVNSRQEKWFTCVGRARSTFRAGKTQAGPLHDLICSLSLSRVLLQGVLTVLLHCIYRASGSLDPLPWDNLD